jgi:hypothetical protein
LIGYITREAAKQEGKDPDDKDDPEEIERRKESERDRKRQERPLG